MTRRHAKPLVFIALVLFCGIFLNHCGSSGKDKGTGGVTPPVPTSNTLPTEWDGVRDYPSAEFTFKELER